MTNETSDEVAELTAKIEKFKEIYTVQTAAILSLESQISNACKLHEVTQVRLARAVEALKSIAFLDQPEAMYYDYWLDNTDLHEVVANDTRIARDALNFINDSENGSEVDG